MEEDMAQPAGEESPRPEGLDEEVERLRAEASRRLDDLEAKLQERAERVARELEQHLETQISALETAIRRAQEREGRVSETKTGLEDSGRALLARVEQLRDETVRQLTEGEERLLRRLDAAVADAAERVRTEILDAASLEQAEPRSEDDERVQVAELTLGVRADSALYRIDERADERVAAAEGRIFEAEKRLLEAVADAERAAHRRLLEAADAAGERIEAVARAQEREERIRERTREAEREADRRVREAEQRLLDLMERADAAESRLASAEPDAENAEGS
jgi:hypothetical protein